MSERTDPSIAATIATWGELDSHLREFGLPETADWLRRLTDADGRYKVNPTASLPDYELADRCDGRTKTLRVTCWSCGKKIKPDRADRALCADCAHGGYFGGS